MRTRWWKKLWRWSLLVTVPITAAFGHWCLAVGERYVDFGLRYKTSRGVVDLHRIGRLEAARMLRQVELTARPRFASEPSELRRVDLFLAEASQERLDANLPHSGREYVGAHLLYPDGVVREASVKYRGDFFWHWAGVKKSLRVKTKKKTLLRGMRSFNLIAPKFAPKLNGHLGYELARRFELLAPHSELVTVSVNGRNRGLYTLVEQLDETFVRKNRRMPGDLFVGELIARDSYRGLRGGLFRYPLLWEKDAVNNHYAEDAYDSIEGLCALLDAEPSAERVAALRDLVDVEAFGRFAAFRLLLQSYHYDEAHNWRLYYDPWRNVFEPVVWDPSGWAPSWVPAEDAVSRNDILTSLLDEVLLLDHRFLLARHRALEAYFAAGRHERFLEQVDGLIEAVDEPLAWDPALIVDFEYERPDDVRRAMRELRDVIARIGDDLRAAYLSDAPSTEHAVTRMAESLGLRLEVDGRRPVERLSFSFSRPIETVSRVQLSWWEGAARRGVDVSGALTHRGAVLELEVPLFARFDVERDESQPELFALFVSVAPATYELRLDGAGFAGNELVSLEIGYGEAERAASVRREAFRTRPFAHGTGVVDPVPAGVPERWSGSMRIEGVRVMRRDVIVEPGTTILMDPGASLIFEGQLTAMGTKQRPIRVLAAEPDGGPWGTIALRGPSAKGSVLEHCEMIGGSGHKEPLAEYSAMLSIHDVPEVAIRHCRFADNLLVDDMVHAVYSGVRFRDCVFERSLFDAIDLDICRGIVEGCRITGSGNDALDLMTSEVVVRDTVLEGSGDKGVAVGEDSRVLVIDSSIEGCDIGLQSKDASQAVLYNVELAGNRMAVDAYRKNWRYGDGGYAYLYKCSLSGNESQLTVDKRSALFLHDSYVDSGLEAGMRVTVDATVDDVDPRVARESRDWRFPEDPTADVPWFEGAWDDVDPAVRGRSGATARDETRTRKR